MLDSGYLIDLLCIILSCAGISQKAEYFGFISPGQLLAASTLQMVNAKSFHQVLLAIRN